MYRLSKRWYPYVPSHPNYGPGCGIPWPDIWLKSVGYTSVPGCEGNLEIKNPDEYGNPDGGKWEIICTWQTGWMAIRSLITGQIIFSVPPGTLEPINET